MLSANARQYSFPVAFLLFALFFATTGCTSFFVPPGWSDPLYRKFLSDAADHEHIVEFYGVVRDQNDQPVVGAEVRCGVTGTAYWYPFSGRDRGGHCTITRRTDEAGRFEVVNRFYSRSYRADTFCIDAIGADGYVDWDLKDQVDQYAYNFYGDESKIHHADPNSPVVFRLRKNVNPTYMIQSDAFLREYVVNEKTVCWFDLSRITSGGWHYAPRSSIEKPPVLGYPPSGDPVTWWDFVAEYRSDDGGKTAALVFRALEEDGGFLASDEELLEAPESGYQREFVLRFPSVSQNAIRWRTDGTAYLHAEMSGKRWLYAKTRRPAVYSRIELKNDIDKGFQRSPVFCLTKDDRPARIAFELTWRLNPYGDRTLELFIPRSGKRPDNSYYFTVEGEMEWRFNRDAYHCLYHGKLPVRTRDMKTFMDECRREVERKNADLHW